jgi:hypothetical protein
VAFARTADHGWPATIAAGWLVRALPAIALSFLVAAVAL